MTKLTYVVNGKEVGTLAEAKALTNNSKEIIARYTPIPKASLTEREIARRDLRMKAFGLA